MLLSCERYSVSSTNPSRSVSMLAKRVLKSALARASLALILPSTLASNCVHSKGLAGGGVVAMPCDCVGGSCVGGGFCDVIGSSSPTCGGGNPSRAWSTASAACSVSGGGTVCCGAPPSTSCMPPL